MIQEIFSLFESRGKAENRLPVIEVVYSFDRGTCSFCQMLLVKPKLSLSEHESVIALETSFEALLTDGLSFQLVYHGFVTPKWI